MKTLSLLTAILFILLVSCKEPNPTTAAAENSIYLTPEIMCGTVQFTDGCGPATDSLIRFGIALVHHMTYEDAAYTFDRVIREDPDCFWGHWGKAMTYIHPLWPDAPTEQQMDEGYVLSQKALALARNEKEKLYGEAIAAYYQKGEMSKAERVAAFGQGWAKVHAGLPDDVEAELFNGLFRIAVVPPSDKTFVVQAEVGQRAEELLQKYPDHPGAFHYGIHAYDVPPLASKALVLARNYGKIAPEIPHALHMPSHIFTRMGLWQESIEWNTRSAKAALRLPIEGKVSPHTFHAMDYMVYAYLQYGEDEKAAAIVNSMDTLSDPFFVNPASAYAIAAMPARLALETHNWKAAAQIPLPDTSAFPWGKFPQYEALIHYARGLGAARSGQQDVAQESIRRLDELKASLGETPQTKYWSDQITLQRNAVNAWSLYTSGKQDEGLKEILAAADLEDNTQKNPISPGELLPVREQAGDMLLEMKKNTEALAQYQQTNERRPNRFNTLYGATNAAKASGNEDLANQYYDHFVALKESQPSKRLEMMSAQIKGATK